MIVCMRTSVQILLTLHGGQYRRIYSVLGYSSHKSPIYNSQNGSSFGSVVHLYSAYCATYFTFKREDLGKRNYKEEMSFMIRRYCR